VVFSERRAEREAVLASGGDSHDFGEVADRDG
jgi:hypothetical protein